MDTQSKTVNGFRRSRKFTLSQKMVRFATRRVLGTVVGVDTTRNALALTFDDGPHPVYTPRLLDLLKRNGARATFFMVGQMAERHPEIVKRVATEGHAIGNHSWDHPSMPLISRAERRRQLAATAAATAPYGSRLFRPPYGHQTFASRVDARMFGYEVIAWSAHVEDWVKQPADELAERIVLQSVPGAILLLHDAIGDVRDEEAVDRDYLLEALERVFARLAGEFEFVTVPELLRSGRPRRREWNKKGDAAWMRTSTTKWASLYTKFK